MSAGIGVTLLAAGVTLRFAVPATFAYGLKVHIVAVIVMLAGVVGLLMSLLVWGPLTIAATTPAPTAAGRRRHVHHPYRLTTR